MSEEEKSEEEFLPDEVNHESRKRGRKKVVSGKKAEDTTEDRLREILEQAETYTLKILGTNANAKKITKPKKKGRPSKAAKRRNNESNDENFNAAEDIEEEEKFLLEKQPSKLVGDLRKYQLDGLNWMISLFHHKASGILADEMGLGKTIQTISLIAFLREFKKINRYFLIIAPKSCIPNWMKEFKKWLPEVKVVNLIAIKEERERILREDMTKDNFDV